MRTHNICDIFLTFVFRLKTILIKLNFIFLNVFYFL